MRRASARGRSGIATTSMSLRGLACALTLVVAPSLCSLGCGSGGPHGPVAPTPHEATGVADEATWMTLASHGARLRVPPGWKYRADAAGVTAEPVDRKAVLVLSGARTRAELETKVRALGRRYGLDRVEFRGGKPGTLNGIPIVMYEDMAAETHGEPADVFVLLGEAPNGDGVVMVFLWASDRTQRHDLDLIQAANTLRPI